MAPGGSAAAVVRSTHEQALDNDEDEEQESQHDEQSEGLVGLAASAMPPPKRPHSASGRVGHAARSSGLASSAEAGAAESLGSSLFRPSSDRATSLRSPGKKGSSVGTAATNPGGLLPQEPERSPTHHPDRSETASCLDDDDTAEGAGSREQQIQRVTRIATSKIVFLVTFCLYQVVGGSCLA